ncbi:MAG TPA: efflux RND transporter permease subunit [Bdellovibrionota bacterium]|nr:efflux RND transporter permease subunit [Bdellovibrionota bacterium]
MTLSEIAIRRPVFAWMLMAALIIFGGVSFSRMGVSQLPDVDFPVVTISLSLLGAAPEVMETQVVDPIEDAVMSVEGVRSVTSSSYEGNATITVELDLDRDIDAALQEVQTKVVQTQRLLPRNMDPAVITKTNPEDQPILWLALGSKEHSVRELMIYVRDQLKDQFTSLPGVGEVMLGGYIEPNMRVWLSERALARYALTVNDVISAIQNESSEPPSGYLDIKDKESNVRTLGEVKSAAEMGRITINLRGGQPNFTPIPLAKVARIEDGLNDIRRISRANGLPAVGLGIRKQRGSNAVQVAHGVKQKLTEVAPRLPKGMVLNVNFDSTQFIEDSVRELNFTLILSALLTALVCWLFLGSWSSTINVLLAIPTSVIGSFIVLYFAGFTLNTFTLLGLALAIGIVVDDAIMVLENIARHRERGEALVEGAINGSREITFAAVAASVAIIAIFLPVAFMTGIIGKFFFQFGVTISVAVLLSLTEALTLTPMRCSQFLKVGERRTRIGKWVEHGFDWSRGFYRRSLAVALNHRVKVVLVSVSIFIVSFMTLALLNKEFVPAQDQSMFMVRLQTPVGSSIAYTDSKFKEAEAFLSSRPEISRYYAAVGGFGGGEVNSGIIFASMKPPGERTQTQEQFMAFARKSLNAIPDLKASLQDLSIRGFTASRGFPVEFAVRGPDWDRLALYSKKIMEELNKTGLVTDLDTDYKEGKPEIRIVPDRERAAERAVNVAAVGDVVSAMIGGVIVGQYSQGGHRYDIRVRLQEKERDQLEEIQALSVRNDRGELIRLSEVVKVEQKAALQVISRRDRQRAVTIFGNVRTGRSQADALNAVNRIAAKVLPAGYSVVLSGSAQTFKESFASLLFVLILGLLVSYMVLASQFNSFIDPVTVLMALPFSVSGAFVALLIGNQTVNIYSLIGLILLMGIVKKNSILLVDFTNQIRVRARRGPDEALLEACPLRLRPIVMTSLATIAGAIPPALAIGPGAETRVPMAIAVIGGIVVSTALTLMVVPCVYSLFARHDARSQRERSEKKAA